MIALDLFSGIGGWTLGLEAAGIATVAACEIDPWRRSVYARRFPVVRLYDDIRTLGALRLAADGVPVPGLIVGSPPCQDASAANTRGRGVDGKRTGLYRQWLRLVSELRPAWTCIENSPRLRTRGVDRLLLELESLDYAVWPLVVSAGDIGAPHLRERVWIVGCRADADRNVQLGKRVLVFPSPGPAGSAVYSNHEGEPGLAVDGGARERLVGGTAGHAPRLGRDGGRPAEAPGRPRAEPSGDGQGHAPDLRSRLPDALLAWAGGWPRWNGGLAGLRASVAAARAGALADGPSASRERNRWIAALGDSIVPQIATAIGRAILDVSMTARTR
jgi:site-specific DNA-cytosine methylase